MQNWSSNTQNYELSDKYSIVKANPEEFAIYESVYYELGFIPGVEFKRFYIPALTS